MNEKDLLSRLRELEELTSSEEKIFRFFEANYPLIAFETIHSISEKCQVGKATVARFVTRLGYDSFSHFMNSLREEVSSQIDTPIQRFSTLQKKQPQENHEHFERRAEFTVKNIEKTRSRLRPGEFERAVNLLANTEGTLYIIGSATSHALAYFFYMLATYMRADVVLLEPSPAALAHKLIDVRSSDTLLAILHYRFSTQTVQTVEWFAQQQASIVLISDKERTPVSKQATVQLYSCSEGPEMFNSRGSTLLILESLLDSMAPLLEKKVYKRFEKFEQLGTHFGTFSGSPHTMPSDILHDIDGPSA